MKKNRMMRLASVLLIMTLLSTSVISGTFAKYVTSGSASDSARVAKWGVTVTATSDSMFEENYAAEDDEWAKFAAYSVVSSGAIPGDGEKKVVAPGTEGSLTKVNLSGTPEVAVRVSYKADLVLTGWEYVGVNKYCPIKFNVNGQVYQIAVGTDPAELEAAVENAINTYSNDYAAGSDLSTVTDSNLAVSWEWPFESGHDDADTALGNQAAAGSPATIELTVTTTVTQID